MKRLQATVEWLQRLAEEGAHDATFEVSVEQSEWANWLDEEGEIARRDLKHGVELLGRWSIGIYGPNGLAVRIDARRKP